MSAHNVGIELNRNVAEEFARRTRTNLDFIRSNGSGEVHQVVQITLSLLGLVVLPWEQRTLNQTKRVSVDQMRADGWWNWTIWLDREAYPTNNLCRVLYHIRNGVSHGRICFTSDHPDPENVEVIIMDALRPNADIDWCAQIRADHLREFCYHALNVIENTVS